MSTSEPRIANLANFLSHGLQGDPLRRAERSMTEGLDESPPKSIDHGDLADGGLFPAAQSVPEENGLIFQVSRSAFAHSETAKRAFDILFSTLLLVALLPVLILLCLGVWLSSPGPIIFRQDRIGRDGVMFKCLKLRTMVIDADVRLRRLLTEDEAARIEWERDQKLRNDPRITPLGQFLRRSSLDELPQLWNILVGDMSVVGPRPIVQAEAIRYGAYLADYCSVRPGLTGPWQIGGRNNVSYEERVNLDVGYARNRSFSGDMAICVETVFAVATSRGSY